MSLVQPFKTLRQGPGFRHTLGADLRLLSSPDLPRAMAIPDRGKFADDGHLAVRELGRRHMFAVLRQAIRKQRVREALWPRFLTCWYLAVPLCILLPFIWVAYLWSNP